jgi:nephron
MTGKKFCSNPIKKFFLFHSTEPTGAANSKSAAIEMYAPSSYNDTVTGETLSSVSDKSDSYSNDGSQPDLTVNKFKLSS